MNRLGPVARIVFAIVVAATLASNGFVATTRAAAPDRSDIVLVLDFSASILQDKANRDRFAGALEGIASRVDETSADLVQGDTTASIVQFAAKAIDTPGCVDLHLLDSPETVGRFADCLRAVAAAYRKGLNPALTKQIGIDTNYVAAMEQAATHLPADAVRPAMILFTDGKHDVKGVPVTQVQPTRDRLFGSRTPFALLPVGMGLDPKDRGPLEAGLQNMRITRDMPPVRQRRHVRVAAGRVRLRRAGGQRGRGRAPGRELHVHGRGHARSQADARARRRRRAARRGHARRRPGHRRLDARSAGHGRSTRHRLPGPLPHG